MKIGIAKIGKSIKFDKDTWSGFGGDCDTPILTEILSNHNPNDTFYLFGRNDWERCSDEFKQANFPNNNIINLFDGLGSKYEDSFDDYIKNVKEANLDHLIVMMGPHGSTNIPKYCLNKNGKDYLIPLDFIKNYAAPVIKVLNETTIPASFILVDPRYKFTSRDLIKSRWPEYYISQYNCKFTGRAITSDEDAKKYKFKPTKSKSKYTGIESLFLYGKKKFDINKLDEAFERKDNVFRLVLNQGLGSGGIDRYPILMKYIGKVGSSKYIENVEIYGKWKDEIYEKDKRFKGPRCFEKLSGLMASCKATLIIPIDVGWVTSKYIECMNGWNSNGEDLGIITFYSKEYDKQGHTIPKGHFRRVTPLTFREKLVKVLTDDEFCKDLYREQYEMLKDEYYNGLFINNLILGEIK